MKIEYLLPKHFIEHEYFAKMFACFNQELLKDYTIYVSHNYNELPSYGDKVIAILTAGDERGIPPKYADKVHLVFKHHLDCDRINNVYHIPLTYVNGFVGDYSIPIEQRKYDVFFAGRKSCREDMIAALEKLQKSKPNLNYRVFITGQKFKAGWDIAKYSREMMNSKIVLSPRGAVRAECLRFTEAVKCGCSIISCKHPDVKCFRECPAKYLSSWNLLEEAVTTILNEPKTLLTIHDKMKYCWDSYFSPAAVGGFINFVVYNHQRLRTEGN